MGLYQLIFSIFSLAVTACTSGVSLAVTRLVAEGNGVRPSVGRCMVLALLISGLAGLVLWCGSGWIAAILLGSPEAARPIRLLVPGLPCMAVCACVKGYFWRFAIPLCLRPGSCWSRFLPLAPVCC